jgi:hypothetical protein
MTTALINDGGQMDGETDRKRKIAPLTDTPQSLMEKNQFRAGRVC